MGRSRGISTETEVLSYLVTWNLNEWGVGEPKKGKHSKLSNLNHFTISRDAIKSNISKLYSFKSREKVVSSIRKYSNSDITRVSAIVKQGILETTTSV